MALSKNAISMKFMLSHYFHSWTCNFETQPQCWRTPCQFLNMVWSQSIGWWVPNLRWPVFNVACWNSIYLIDFHGVIKKNAAKIDIFSGQFPHVLGFSGGIPYSPRLSAPSNQPQGFHELAGLHTQGLGLAGAALWAAPPAPLSGGENSPSYDGWSHLKPWENWNGDKVIGNGFWMILKIGVFFWWQSQTLGTLG